MKEIFGLEAYKLALLFTLTTAVGSGYIFMLAYSPDLFYSLDLFRLTVMSLSVSTPIIMINVSLTDRYLNGFAKKLYPKGVDEVPIGVGATIGSQTTLFTIYISSMVGYIIDSIPRVDVHIVQGIVVLFITNIITYQIWKSKLAKRLKVK